MDAILIDKKQKLTLIQGVSDLFYQSLLCPDNARFVSEAQTISANGAKNGYVNARCQCEANYTVMDGACVESCGGDEYRNNLGACTKCNNGELSAPQSSGGFVMENNTCTIN